MFEGRPFYVRSDAPGDALGRGVYESHPFANASVSLEEKARISSFSSRLLQVIISYFTPTAAKFREKLGITEKGMNVLLSQFIGREGNLMLEGVQRRVLTPFLSAIVKTTLVEGIREGLIRFEYGLGTGALRGKSILCNESGTETILENIRSPGIDTNILHASPDIILLPEERWFTVSGSNAIVSALLFSSAYAPLSTWPHLVAAQLLKWLALSLEKFEKKNGGKPLYLELASSSFTKENSMRWFAVQAADFEPLKAISAPPGKLDFIRQADFSGHGRVSDKKRVYFFGPKTFVEGGLGIHVLKRINSMDRGFIVIVPQQALSGTNLTSMSGTHFSNASAVIEYGRIDEFSSPIHYHEQASSSEHFEQLMLDFEVLFVGVDTVLENGKRSPVMDDGIIQADVDCNIACDKERGIAWGKFGKFENQQNIQWHL